MQKYQKTYTKAEITIFWNRPKLTPWQVLKNETNNVLTTQNMLKFIIKINIKNFSNICHRWLKLGIWEICGFHKILSITHTYRTVSFNVSDIYMWFSAQCSDGIRKSAMVWCILQTISMYVFMHYYMTVWLWTELGENNHKRFLSRSAKTWSSGRISRCHWTKRHAEDVGTSQKIL